MRLMEDQLQMALYKLPKAEYDEALNVFSKIKNFKIVRPQFDKIKKMVDEGRATENEIYAEIDKLRKLIISKQSKLELHINTDEGADDYDRYILGNEYFSDIFGSYYDKSTLKGLSEYKGV